MEVLIRERKLKRALEDDRLCCKQFGAPMSKFLRRRLDALSAANCLFDFWPPKSKPERIHRLTSRDGFIYTADLQQPYRLVFTFTPDDPKNHTDTKEFWLLIDTIEILGIEDTHG